MGIFNFIRRKNRGVQDSGFSSRRGSKTSPNSMQRTSAEVDQLLKRAEEEIARVDKWMDETFPFRLTRDQAEAMRKADRNTPSPQDVLLVFTLANGAKTDLSDPIAAFLKWFQCNVPEKPIFTTVADGTGYMVLIRVRGDQDDIVGAQECFKTMLSDRRIHVKACEIRYRTT